VLDPFAGTFTVGLVGLRHGCDVIGIELNEEYCEMALRRVLPGLLAEMMEGAASGAPTRDGGDDGEESCDS
jgi:DNA modification methylase